MPCSAEKLPSSVAHHLVHRVHDGVILRQEPRRIGVDRLLQIEVDVAVAHVAERHGADAGHQRLARSGGAADEFRHLRHRHRNVVLHAGAFALLRLGVFLAQPPDRGALRLASPRSRRPTPRRRPAPPPAPSPTRRADPHPAAASQVPPARNSAPGEASGSVGTFDMPQHELGPETRHQFERADRRRVVRLEAAEQIAAPRRARPPRTTPRRPRAAAAPASAPRR